MCTMQEGFGQPSLMKKPWKKDAEGNYYFLVIVNEDWALAVGLERVRGTGQW